MQHFNKPQTIEQISSAVVASQSTEREAQWHGVFAFLSLTGQQTVGEYLAHLERGLVQVDYATAVLSAFERGDALREIQNHLASLIVAYQELGDDEQTAIRSALAQFGSAKNVSSGLRRAKTKASSFPFDLAVSMALFTLAMFMPLLLLDGSGQSDLGQFGWPGLFLLPFAAGAFAATRKGEGAWYRVLAAIGLVIASTFLMSFVLTEQVQTVHEFFSVVLRLAVLLSFVWSLSARAGWAALRHLKAIARKQKAA